MYCIKCGVELADSEGKCPLCGTVVYHPDLEKPKSTPPFPRYKKEVEVMNRGGILFILTALLAIPVAITLFCDLTINFNITWSGYVVGSILLIYISTALPLWFKNPNPVVFVPVSFAAAALFVMYINLHTGGQWFLGFAFPAIGIMGLIVSVTVALLKYVRKGQFFIFGGLWIALGGYCMLLELFIDITFNIGKMFYWSPYPMIACLIIGIMLIVIGISKPLRESIYKKFFI